MYPEREIVIALGNTCIGIRCEDREFMEKLTADYEPFLVSVRPDLSIHFNLRNKLSVSDIRHIIEHSKVHSEGDRFYTEMEMIDCRMKWSEATLEVETEKNIFNAEVNYRFMNLMLRGLYSGIFRKMRKTKFDDYLVHGCGVANGERCYLFTGPSGSGKTTVASLAGGREILNDETVLIGRNDHGFRLSGTPFDGGLHERNNSKYHLSAIFFLKHDRQVTIRKLNEVDTYKRLLTQVFDTSPLFESPDNDSFSEQAELCSRVASGVPAYELGFLPDSSFWPYIESI